MDTCPICKQEKTVINTPAGIDFIRLAVLKAGLTLEIRGLRRSGARRSAYSLLRDMGYKGTRKNVLAQVNRAVDTEILKSQGPVA